MARVTAEKVAETKIELLEAARRVLTEQGFSGLSTRRVAEAAQTQMSQIRYHFGSKEGMILALFEHLNAGLIERQAKVFEAPGLSVSEKWDLACDYLEDDLASGYVRVLQELIAAGWSNPAVGEAVRAAMAQWHRLILSLATDLAARRPAGLGVLGAEEFAALVSAAFIGAEAQILLGVTEADLPLRAALRRVADIIRMIEEEG